jgi:hypothetical protein
VNVIFASLWRLDVNRQLSTRVEHLLSKVSAAHTLRWLWVVGDSVDDTELRLREEWQRFNPSLDVTIVRCDSGIRGEDLLSRRRRIGLTVQQTFDQFRSDDDLICLHESDLLSDPKVVDRLLQGPIPTAGWSTIAFEGRSQFYDIWGFRDLRGRNFDPFIRRPNGPFQVSAFGSCWIGPVALCRNRQIGEEVVVGLCKQWRHEGVRLWCDPRVEIVQPVELWEAQ